VLIASLFIAAVSIPYLFAQITAGDETVFSGFLINPLDGNTYLAKLYQGWRGEWRYTLPYSAEPGQGAYVFLFYLGLGHLARWTGIPLLATFHLARLVGAAVLTLAVYHFCVRPLPDTVRKVGFYLLALFGSGLGWLAAPFGGFTPDLWVPEAYPFLSAYATPHFSLGLAILLLLLYDAVAIANHDVQSLWSGEKRGALLRTVLLAFFLAIVNPFGVVIALVALGGLALWDLWAAWRSMTKKETGSESDRVRWPGSWVALGAVTLGGAPYLLYSFWALNSEPVLAGWTAQNITPSPPVLDLLIALLPVLLPAIGGVLLAVRTGERRTRLLAAWLILGFLLLYLPLNLQRRLMTGLFIPVVGLAGVYFAHLRSLRPRLGNLIMNICLILALPSNLVLISAHFSGVREHPGMIYLERGEAQALEWIETNTPSRALVLATPEMGMYIPAHTGRRVIYGHPFETVNASQEKESVTRFFSGELPDPAGFLAQRQIDYIFYGPREQALGALPEIPGLRVVYQNGGVTVYAVGQD
jgi:hypothetical protein